jgi:predicted NACHT family NTPase
MGKNSCKASPEGIKLAKNALDGIFNGNQTALREDLNDTTKELADDLNDEALKEKVKKEGFCISRSTLSKFFNGGDVNRFNFQVICSRLHLDWRKIKDSSPQEEQKNNSPEIDTLVQDIRQKVQADIKESCGTMKVLDMNQPIDLGSIYTQVNILKKTTQSKRIDINKLEEGFDLENFDRLGWSKSKNKRVEGFQAVLDYNKLMVLGKPGAGKTTFLKYLAIQCNNGHFLKDCVPVFIPLKEFAETELDNQTQPGLLDYISQRLGECEVIENQSKTEQLLKAGRVFVLLDGLDEVREQHRDRIIKEIRDFSQKFSLSRFVITCRIAANEYTFTDFVDVEVADFALEQIKKFAKCWFKIKKLDDYTKDFIQQLEDNPQIKELATNPLLLTLLCLEFEDSRSFPANRAQLYKRATETLLRRWDDKRGIDRGEEVYKQLSVKRKEDLLSQIAYSTFSENHYFFKRGIVENHIADYISNLPNAPTEQLDIDSEAVLKSIEAQHGLLVEFATDIYSFSHSTFQEYFTAQHIVNKKKLPELVEHITEKRWREVFLLTAGLPLSNADDLLKLMKQQVDRLLAEDEKMQNFLTWANRKANSVETSDKPATVGNFFMLFGLDLSLDLDLSFYPDFYLSQNLSHNLNGDLNQDFNLDFSRYITEDLSRDDIRDLIQQLRQFSNEYLKLDIPLELKEIVQNLTTQLPHPGSELEIVEQWFIESTEFFESLSNQFRNFMIKNSDISHDWGFTKEEKERFLQYVDANNILLECMNNKNNYITRAVREEIESSLYLPVEQAED